MAKEHEIKQALAEVGDQLTALPNVVGYGVRALDDADPKGELALAVYVRKKLPKTQLAASDVVPKTVGTTLDGERVEVPTRVIEVGEIKPQ